MITKHDANLPGTAPDIILTGRFTPEQERQYVHLPFEIPAGVRQIHLRCTYNDRIGSDPTLAGGNTLDIGLFDERSTAGGGPGFRGWSGSESLAFTVAEDWATPPYRSGPIGAGNWHVLLGPYKIGPGGLDYRIEIFLDPGLLPAERPRIAPPSGRTALDPPALPGWVRGDLHCHTRHSDGDSWPEEVLAAASAAGLDFLGITDHNAARPHVPPSADSGLPLLLPGVEVTTYGGHWNAWGGGRWYDFREPDGEKVGEVMRRAVADGAFVSVNHPRPFGPAWTYGGAAGFQAVEVWNGPWLALNAVALAFWDELLRQGRRVVAVGGSDTHHLRPRPNRLIQPHLGEPTTWVEVDGPLSVAALLTALKAGRCFVSAGPTGPELYLTWAAPVEANLRVIGGAGDVLLLISDAGCFSAETIDRGDVTLTVPVPASARYVRAQLMDTRGNARTISNPVWTTALT